MRVAVAGAGLGGLAVASGLARAGHEVVVLEADRAPDARSQGYRLHLDSRGLRPLEALLPARSYALVEATCGEFADPRRLQVLTARLQRLRTLATGPGRVDGRLVSTAVDRGTLRSILVDAATASGAQIRWDAAVLGYDDGDSAVRVRTAGGEPRDDVEADLLVGADGARSRVAAQRWPGPRVHDGGGRSIVGRSPVTAVSPRLLGHLTHGYVVLRGLRTGVGLGLMRFATPPDQAGRAAGVALDPVADYVSWNVGLPAAGQLDGADPEVLQRNAVRRIRTWHPDVRSLVAAADPARTFLAAALTAEPAPTTPDGRVTLLGDAAHVVPPERGSGANLALADAARLVEALGEATRAVSGSG